MSDIIQDDTILCRNLDQTFSMVDEEVIMLSIEKGMYFTLNEVGSFIWNKLNKPTKFKDLIFDLLVAYSISQDACIQDTKEYLYELLKNEIIEVIK